VFGEGTVAADVRLSDGVVTGYASGEDAPRDWLGDADVRGWRGRRCCGEGPGRGGSGEEPASSAVSIDVDLKRSAGRRIDGAEGVRQAAQEAVENRVVKIGCHDARALSGFADLLLMMPALGEFARGVEPVERGRFAGPAYVEERGSERVERLVEFSALTAGGFHQIDEHGRAEPTIDSDAFAIEAVDEINDVLLRADGWLFDEPAVADHGKLAESGVEKVRGYVTNFPCRRQGLQVPLIGSQSAKKLDEL